MTVEELEVEYLAWRAWNNLATLDPLQEARQTAYLEALARGEIDTSDAARDAWLAAWHPPGATDEGVDDVESVEIPPPEEG